MYNSLWFDSVIKPPLAPPDSLFSPVWIFLYITIFVALVLYIRKPKEFKESGYIYFGIQLFLNIIWSPVFFAAKNIGAALFVIVLLDIFVILMVRKFYSVSRAAGLILVPYLIWILFATYLNAGYFLLN